MPINGDNNISPLDGVKHSVGTTLEDATMLKRFVLLSDAQVTFMHEHPLASIAEVWNMELVVVPPKTLQEVKTQKLADLEAYDTSTAVNEFYFEGMPLWIDRDTRLALKDRLERETVAGKESTMLRFGPLKVELPIETASQVLTGIMFYADAAYDITADHILAISALEIIEEVEAYDFTAGYPNKPTFNVPTNVTD